MFESFPKEFVWGSATAAYQIEGGVTEGGRGPSVWDTFSHVAGNTANGDTGDVACDHFHRWRDDLDLIDSLGLHAYRLSTGWSRIMPDGDTPNPAGLDFYDRLIDGLLARDVTPFVTLNHWDLPQALEDRGGWRARSTAEAFVRYAEVVAERLGDRVSHWFTHNEPWVVAWLGHVFGEHAPGRRSRQEGLDVAHHLLLSHGWALPVIRRAAPGAEAGIVLNLIPKVPASSHPADVAAADLEDGSQNRWFLEPLAGRSYPNDVTEALGWDPAAIKDGDMATIATDADFLGVNFYNRNVIKAADIDDDERPTPITEEGPEFTEMGWEINPSSLYDTLMRVQHRYGLGPLFITENGAAMPDETHLDGVVDDQDRIAYLDRHLRAARRAIADGVDVRGYFVWSLMDNFEWARGYGKRFGVVHVDSESLVRTPKASARWYSDVIARNGLA
jgi:beta-glucosidase